MIQVIQGDILQQKVDAIVNPANTHLQHGGGLAAIIDKAATNRDKVEYDFLAGHHDHIDRELDAIEQWHREQIDAPLVPTGYRHLTSAGVLPFKAVIHAVGPIWGGGNFQEEQLLFSANYWAIEAAASRGWSVAVPAISCGIYRFPIELAAPIAIKAASLVENADVTFVLFEDEHMDAYLRASRRN